MNKIKLVTLDMAGTTLTDHKEVETCFAQACKLSKLEVSAERIQALQGYAKKEVFQLLWDEKIGEDHPEYEENVFTSYDLFCEILEHHYHTNTCTPTAHCLETLAWLRENKIKIALTTGFYRKVANVILDNLGWLNGLDKDYKNIDDTSPIDLSVTPTEVSKGRPAPDMIQYAMAQFGISDPKEVINVGDTPVDLQSGFQAQVRMSLAVTNGTHSKADLEIHPNDGLLSDISEIVTIIKQLN